MTQFETIIPLHTARLKFGEGATEELGYELKNYNNRQTDIVVVHEGKPWLSNKTTWSVPSMARPKPGSTGRVLLSTKDREVEGWELHKLPDPMTPADLAEEAISWLVGRAAELESLDLAVAGPYPLAWAAAQVLRNWKHARCFHWDTSRSSYELWFEG